MTRRGVYGSEAEPGGNLSPRWRQPALFDLRPDKVQNLRLAPREIFHDLSPPRFAHCSASLSRLCSGKADDSFTPVPRNDLSGVKSDFCARSVLNSAAALTLQLCVAARRDSARRRAAVTSSVKLRPTTRCGLSK